MPDRADVSAGRLILHIQNRRGYAPPACRALFTAAFVPMSELSSSFPVTSSRSVYQARSCACRFYGFQNTLKKFLWRAVPPAYQTHPGLSRFYIPGKIRKKTGLQNRPSVKGALCPVLPASCGRLSLTVTPWGNGDLSLPTGHCTAGINKTGGAGFIYPHRHKVQHTNPNHQSSLLIKRIFSSKIGIGA